MSKNKHRSLNMSGWQREHYGCVVTFKNATGELLTLHRTGKNSIAATCALAVSADETFRVVCISTPGSIYSDLLGRSPGKKEKVNGLEAGVLGQLGLRHMLHPSLRGTSDASLKSWYGE